MSVRREDGIKHVPDGRPVDDEGHPLEKCQACDREGWEFECPGQSPILVGEERVGPVQPLDGLELVSGALRGEPGHASRIARCRCKGDVRQVQSDQVIGGTGVGGRREGIRHMVHFS